MLDLLISESDIRKSIANWNRKIKQSVVYLLIDLQREPHLMKTYRTLPQAKTAWRRNVENQARVYPAQADKAHLRYCISPAACPDALGCVPDTRFSGLLTDHPRK